MGARDRVSELLLLVVYGLLVQSLKISKIHCALAKLFRYTTSVPSHLRPELSWIAVLQPSHE